jgi:hypothetical protein
MLNWLNWLIYGLSWLIPKIKPSKPLKRGLKALLSHIKPR